MSIESVNFTSGFAVVAIQLEPVVPAALKAKKSPPMVSRLLFMVRSGPPSDIELPVVLTRLPPIFATAPFVSVMRGAVVELVRAEPSMKNMSNAVVS